jgi:hypothetical protein
MSFDGKWQVSIATPIGKQSVLFEITTENGVIQGRATQGAETISFYPTLQNEHLTWTQSITRPLRLTLAFDVWLDGSTMKGTAKAGFLPSSSLVGERLLQ